MSRALPGVSLGPNGVDQEARGASGRGPFKARPAMQRGTDEPTKLPSRPRLTPRTAARRAS
eukprot:7876909-Pyramimonas_sp.AAC.1